MRSIIHYKGIKNLGKIHSENVHRHSFQVEDFHLQDIGPR